MSSIDSEFPYSLTIDLPLPTNRLASAALRSLQVDVELSPLVRRTLSLAQPPSSEETPAAADGASEVAIELQTVLRTEYKAASNRMLRVAVNGFMESLGVVLGVMEELDVDVLEAELGGK
ncbi:hypothetical protein AJ80_08780 [Polytolypa hystricis UAMH7299]|uniref:Uncharacterized protein n=1 Tax=Polytolypa hystricis (strain UAMH7299) TaxID=1447883 RepID=A0A2B7X2A8_POLH7|nr:hypothetical protein AJ80_08780 [Polytolypa hystricis UAMH7299]